MVVPDVVDVVAGMLLDAARTGTPTAPVRDLIGAADGTIAYAVQRRITAARLGGGARIVGRKIGLTAAAVQAQLGVDRPDYGVLFDDMGHRDGADIGPGLVLQPRAEAEVAFILAEDLDGGPLDRDQVAGAVDRAVAAIEICGSRIADWDISFADTVADNASAGAYVLGSRELTLADFDPRDVTMTMTIGDEIVSRGTGRDCLGDPLKALAWLARQARDLGDPLRAGHIVLSGALGPMRAVRGGDVVRAEIAPFGNVSFTLTSHDDEDTA